MNCCHDVLLVHLGVSGTTDAVQVRHSHIYLIQKHTMAEESLVLFQELLDLLNSIVNGMNDNIDCFVVSVVRDEV